MPRNIGASFLIYGAVVKKVMIRENAWVAWLAAKLLRSKQMAIVFGRTIYLHNTPAASFLSNKRWLLHELKHVEQYERDGVAQFIVKYFMYSLRYGYAKNPYELEACAAETDLSLLNKYSIK